jgi:DUF4097 and DUF4098 domain-containing protein YvlB
METAMIHRFATPTPPRLRIEFRSGAISIRTDDVDETTVELVGRRDDDATARLIAETLIEQRGDTIVVLVPRRSGGIFSRPHDLDLTIRAPRRAALAIESATADLSAHGEFGTSSVQSGTGDVTIDHITETARVRAGSGDIRIETIDGDADITAGSGDVHLGRVGGTVSVTTGSGDVRLGAGGVALDVKTGSGDVRVDVAPTQVSAKTGSGDLRIESVRRGEIRARTASGDIWAGVPTGTAAWLDVRTVTGRVSSELDQSGDPADDEDRVRLQLETVTGDIDLVRIGAA